VTALVLEPTTTAQWQRLVQEASTNASLALDEELESYLVFLLERSCAQTDVLQRIMALDYLHGLTTDGRERRERLREVGDHCLLFAGLFPHIARKRLVRIGYFVEIGRGAYLQLAEALHQSAANLYNNLAIAFVVMMDVLQSMRELQGVHTQSLSPLEAMDLVLDSGSNNALKSLRRYTQAQPVIVATSTQHQ
jgi:hypothetical protein